jgi:aspartate/methionine/tyrosine aminotransferase
MLTLTDFEIAALGHPLNLADGHATHESFPLCSTLDDVAEAWGDCYRISIPDAEQRFRARFAQVAASPTLEEWATFKICPTASASIQIVGAVLAALRKRTHLIQPTFDNLALLLKRQNVNLSGIDEDELAAATADGRSDEYLASLGGGAIFITNPNNPTGRTLGQTELRWIAEHCARAGKVLVLDNSFRLFCRNHFDDYRILADTGVSFLALEDTGKTVPAYEMKASLLICSADLEPLVAEIYNEVYLCTSPFTLLVLERFLHRYLAVGLRAVLWDVVDERRALIRKAIAGSGMAVADGCAGSHLPVEWIDCSGTGLSDLEVRHFLALYGLLVLPGRQFFWDSADDPRNQSFIRLAMLKPSNRFHLAVERLAQLTRFEPHFDRGKPCDAC